MGRWWEEKQKPMRSSGADHDTQCRAPGAPSACWVVPHSDFQEILWNDYVANVPYNPMKDIGSVNLPIRAREQKLTLWERTFWVCNRNEEEKAAYDKVQAEHFAAMRKLRRQWESWWFRAITWIVEKTWWRFTDGRR